MNMPVGTHLGPYEVLGPLGRGGMGEVYRARDTRLERDVAIKILPAKLTASSTALKRFEREAKTLAALSHPNILTIYDVGRYEGNSFVVMELLCGETLRERIAHSPPTWERTIQIITAVLQGLTAAHAHGIIHRDLKPENIFITSDDHVKILDFGLAKRFESNGAQIRSDLETQVDPTEDGTVLGTVPYMSPEQARGEHLDPKSDIFSTGIILYELLTHHLPFHGSNPASVIYKILNEIPPPVSSVQAGIPEWIDPIIEHALAKKKEDRYSTTVELLQDINSRGTQTARLTRRRLRLPLRVLRIAAPIAAVLVLGSLAAVRVLDHRAHVQWAKQQALPEIRRQIQTNFRDFTEAYQLAEAAEEYIPNDPELAALFPQCSVRINVKTTPAGAKVYMKVYKLPDSEWKYLGISPIEKVRVPVGIFRWKIEKEGYETVLGASTSFDTDLNKRNLFIPLDFERVLDRKETAPPGMVHVMGATVDGMDLPDFYIDRFEVTNQQYRTFVDAGGYSKMEYWNNSFILDGKPVAWNDAVTKFIDQTARPGPATWQAGTYPQGEANLPVSGISWYEAAAYANFAGKELPTGSHWGLATGGPTPLISLPQFGGMAVFAPFSNFLGKGPVTVGSLPGITVFGAYDMAGNVREWCWNKTTSGRLIRGGAWGDNIYMFSVLSQAPPMDRSAKNGFRCALYPHREKIPQAAFELVKPPEATRDLYQERPVPDAIYKVYKEQFDYDKAALNAQIESRKENPEGWALERITFDAPYGNERIIASLFLPKNAKPPYQTVIYFPGSASDLKESSTDIENYYEFPIFLSFIVKNGRAVLYPVYKGTFERKSDPTTLLLETNQFNSHQYTELFIQEVKDFRKCIDYLETRPDIDSSKIAYYGMSWGGLYGSIIPAIETRIRASVVVAGGMIIEPIRPEVDPINYVGHVKVPTLMLNGKYDTFLPYAKAIRPMFDLLGTPRENKQLKIYDTDHIPPENEFIKETLAWLDRYLGPVQKN